jgi:hypothetical protein
MSDEQRSAYLRGKVVAICEAILWAKEIACPACKKLIARFRIVTD